MKGRGKRMRDVYNSDFKMRRGKGKEREKKEVEGEEEGEVKETRNAYYGDEKMREG